MTKIAQITVSKALVAFVAAAMLFTMFATPVKAATSVEDLQKMINDLMAQIAALQGNTNISGGNCAAIPAPLTIGAQNSYVTNLQNYLLAAGQSIPAGATGYFGTQTQSALAAWQAANGVSPAVGYYGPITAAAMAAKCVPVDTDGDNNNGGSTSDLKGGAGSIEEAKFMGSLNNEEVGEGEEDVEVSGLEVKPENSDIALTAVKLTFDHAQGDEASGSATRLDKYADEVSVWLDGEEIARVDADEFTKSSTGIYYKTISLDSAVIRDGEVGELVVAVSAISNLDSTDATEEWGVAVNSIRYKDAQGAIVTETSTGDIGDADYRIFSFEDFATSADMNFKVRSDDTAINTARTIEVSSTTKMTNEDILSFSVEIEGSSDMNLDELTVDATTTNAVLTGVISTAYLVMDGDVVGSESITSAFATAAEITFDDLDLDLEAGETYEFVVRVDFQKATGSFVTGTTIDMDVASADVDDTAKWVLEDENGDTVGASDRSGSASADAHTLVTEGVNITLGSATSVQVTDANSTAASYGQYTVEVEITAIGDDVFVLQTAASSSVALTSSGVQYIFENSSNAQATTASTTSASLTYKSGGTVDGSSIRIADGQTAVFELVATFDPTTAGQYGLRVTGVGFGTTNSGTGSSQTASPASDFRTGKVYVSN